LLTDAPFHPFTASWFSCNPFPPFLSFSCGGVSPQGPLNRTNLRIFPRLFLSVQVLLLVLSLGKIAVPTWHGLRSLLFFLISDLDPHMQNCTPDCLPISRVLGARINTPLPMQVALGSFRSAFVFFFVPRAVSPLFIFNGSPTHSGREVHFLRHKPCSLLDFPPLSPQISFIFKKTPPPIPPPPPTQDVTAFVYIYECALLFPRLISLCHFPPSPSFRTSQHLNCIPYVSLFFYPFSWKFPL